MTGKFLYFAYGSNLLSKRIHINNPSAVRAGLGKLQGYRLDFNTYSKSWKGATAAIIKTPGEHVWGALWEMDMQDQEHLDWQEEVHEHVYFPTVVEILCSTGETKLARTYEQCDCCFKAVNIKNLPEQRKPSQIYLSIIKKGAEETGLPMEYKNFLNMIPHNGYNGEVDIGLTLNEIKNN